MDVGEFDSRWRYHSNPAPAGFFLATLIQRTETARHREAVELRAAASSVFSDESLCLCETGARTGSSVRDTVGSPENLVFPEMPPLRASQRAIIAVAVAAGQSG